jgi:hypothetical protein
MLEAIVFFTAVLLYALWFALAFVWQRPGLRRHIALPRSLGWRMSALLGQLRLEGLGRNERNIA